MISNGSPFWLQVFGRWYRAEGVERGASMAPGRASSSLVTLDGVQYVQKAPAGPRSWSLSLAYQAPDVVAALQVAAETDTDVWLMDETASMANMLAPSDCYGSGPLVACWPLWLPALDLSTERQIEVPVRGGVPYWLRFWGDTNGSEVTVASGETTLLAVDSSVLWPDPDVWPDDWPGSPEGAVDTFTPDADGTVTITLPEGATIAGLMLTERVKPVEFAQGQRMPCKVSVGDLSQTAQMAWADRSPLSDWTLTLTEVG